MAGFNAAKDSAGVAIKNRAANQRWNYMTGEGFGRSPINSLGMGSDWEGLFQAMQEMGVDNVADNSVGQRRGMFSGNVAQSKNIAPGQGRDRRDLFAVNKSGVGGGEMDSIVAGLDRASRRR